MSAYLVLGKNLNLLWSTFYAIGQNFIAANGLKLTNNLAIWSHCPRTNILSLSDIDDVMCTPANPSGPRIRDDLRRNHPPVGQRPRREERLHCQQPVE